MKKNPFDELKKTVFAEIETLLILVARWLNRNDWIIYGLLLVVTALCWLALIAFLLAAFETAK